MLTPDNLLVDRCEQRRAIGGPRLHLYAVTEAYEVGHRGTGVDHLDRAALSDARRSDISICEISDCPRSDDRSRRQRANALRVQAEAVRWGKRGARVNTISPGIVKTPLANDELSGPRGPGYRRMIDLCPVGRAGTPDEVGAVGALLLGPDGAFITGSDFLMDGGVTASFFYGELAP